MTSHAITVRIAFVTDPFAITPTWVDVSNDLVAFSIKRGRQHQLDRIEAGTASILLKNLHGNYWPNNDGGTYYPEVKLGKRINIRVVYDETTYDEYTGFIRKWNPKWFSRESNLYPGMLVECADLQRNLARAKLNDVVGYIQELSGARVGRVLTVVGWPVADRDIDGGKENMIATGALANVISMEHLFKVQESELGSFFIAGNGNATFQERGSLEAGESQATFGTGNLPIFDPVFPLDDELLYNEIRLTRESGTEQTHSDAASILAHGLRTLSRSGLLLTSDAIVFVYCLYLLARYHAAKMRIKSFTVKPQTSGYESTLWPLVLGLEIGQKVTLVWTEADISGDYFIEGIEHSWDYREGTWITKYQCSDAGQYYYEPDAIEETLRPNAAGDTTELTPVGAATGHECTDEEVADDMTTYVRWTVDGGYSGEDLYNLENASYAAGVINKVTAFWRVKSVGGLPPSADRIIKTNGVEYRESYQYADENWHDITEEMTTNPQTGQPWTWAEVNALQIGIQCAQDLENDWSICTQIYAVVNFTPSW